MREWLSLDKSAGLKIPSRRSTWVRSEEHTSELQSPCTISYAVGSIKETFAKYTHLTKVLPAMGYSKTQVHELEATINATDCDVVVSGTPIDLNRILKANKPIIRTHYDLVEIGKPDLEDVLSGL